MQPFFDDGEGYAIDCVPTQIRASVLFLASFAPQFPHRHDGAECVSQIVIGELGLCSGAAGAARQQCDNGLSLRF